MPLPPDGFEDSVTDCPESIVGLAGVIVPATKAELTVTESLFEHAVSAPPELLSVTL